MEHQRLTTTTENKHLIIERKGNKRKTVPEMIAEHISLAKRIVFNGEKFSGCITINKPPVTEVE